MTELHPWQQNFLTLYGLTAPDRPYRLSPWIRAVDAEGHTWQFVLDSTPAAWVATYIGTTHWAANGKHYTIGQRP